MRLVRYKDKKKMLRAKKKIRIRKKISGTSERPRLTVFRSAKHIYAQLIDDVNGTVLAASSTRDDLGLKSTSNKEAAEVVGKTLGQKAVDKKISEVVFDRNGLIYHGRVKSLADGARESGLKF